MQGIPENPSLLSLSRGVLPGGMLAGDLPGNPNSNNPQKNSTNDGDNQNENGIRPTQEHQYPKRKSYVSFNSKKDISSSEATAKLLRKNRLIARLDIVCLIIFPIVFILYGVIYLMTTLML